MLVDELRRKLSLGGLVGAAVLVSLTVVVVRLLSMALPGLGGTARERLAVGWSAMRRAISLAAALAIPNSVGGRDEIIFITFVVILVTLVGQGLSLTALLRVLGIQGPPSWSPKEAIARLEAPQSALDRLDELEDEGASEEQLRRLRELYRARFRRCQAAIGGDGAAQAGAVARHRARLRPRGGPAGGGVRGLHARKLHCARGQGKTKRRTRLMLQAFAAARPLENDSP